MKNEGMPQEVRSYQLHLLDAGTSWSQFNQTVCALKFFYRVTLKVGWSVEQIPYGRKPRSLPVVLSQDEVVRLIEAVPEIVYRMALLTAYAAGLRITETVALRAEHIDSARVVIADLTLANPNVYLEVGYAWGRARPTILVVRDVKELRFDVQGTRCLAYQNIRHLEELLTKELAALPANG